MKKIVRRSISFNDAYGLGLLYRAYEGAPGIKNTDEIINHMTGEAKIIALSMRRARPKVRKKSGD